MNSKERWPQFAARGGRDGEDDWSSAFDAEGKPIANTWQGVFPVYNTNEDGYAGTAPVGCFKPNGYGLYDMIGNVWEWTSDWYRPGHPRDAAVNPRGPELQDLTLTGGQSPSRVIKGGSYLCAPPTTAHAIDRPRGSRRKWTSAPRILGFEPF